MAALKNLLLGKVATAWSLERHKGAITWTTTRPFERAKNTRRQGKFVSRRVCLAKSSTDIASLRQLMDQSQLTYRSAAHILLFSGTKLKGGVTAAGVWSTRRNGPTKALPTRAFRTSGRVHMGSPPRKIMQPWSRLRDQEERGVVHRMKSNSAAAIRISHFFWKWGVMQAISLGVCNGSRRHRIGQRGLVYDPVTALVHTTSVTVSAISRLRYMAVKP